VYLKEPCKIVKNLSQVRLPTAADGTKYLKNTQSSIAVYYIAVVLLAMPQVAVLK
jgi:hypothetical protein